MSQGVAATAACMFLVAMNPRSSGGESGLTMGMVYSTAMKSRRPHPKSAGAGCRRSTPATPAAEHHSGRRAHPSAADAAAAPISFAPAPPPGAGWSLRRRVVVVAAAAVRLGGGMYAGTGWRRSRGVRVGLATASAWVGACVGRWWAGVACVRGPCETPRNARISVVFRRFFYRSFEGVEGRRSRGERERRFMRADISLKIQVWCSSPIIRHISYCTYYGVSITVPRKTIVEMDRRQ